MSDDEMPPAFSHEFSAMCILLGCPEHGLEDGAVTKNPDGTLSCRLPYKAEDWRGLIGSRGE